MMRIIYKTGTKKGDNYEEIEKIIDASHVTFYNTTQTIEVGNRVYTFVEEPGDSASGPYLFEDFKNEAFKTGRLDLRPYSYEIVDTNPVRNNQRRSNYRRSNNVYYRNYNRR